MSIGREMDVAGVSQSAFATIPQQVRAVGKPAIPRFRSCDSCWQVTVVDVSCVVAAGGSMVGVAAFACSRGPA